MNVECGKSILEFNALEAEKLLIALHNNIPFHLLYPPNGGYEFHSDGGCEQEVFFIYS